MEFKMKLIIGLWCFVLVYAQNRTIPVRLVGSDGTQGDIEIFDKLSRRWKGMCDDGWNLKAATVVCRQLNLGPPVSIYSHSTESPGVDYGIENVTCIGTESNIAECSYTTYHDCYRHESAGVICSPIQIRLIGGIHKTWKNRTRDGRVEMLSNGEWGTICNVGFDKQDADVMCRQLGFPGAKRLGIPGEYGNGNAAMPIHLSHLECAGTESEIYQCNGNEQPTGCTHNNDVSVECLPLVQLTNGNATSDGVLEILYQGEWYATCPPNHYIYPYYYYYYYYYRYPSYNNDGDVVCKELGYYGGVVISGRRQQLTYQSSHQLWYYDLYCDGTENSIYDCTSQYGYDDFYNTRYCSYVAEYSCQSLQLNNRINATGMLQFLDISGWIPICFTDAFNEFAADVACQQLGYPFATSFISEALSHNLPGIGITGANCRETNAYGYEGYLFNCVNFTKMICQTQLHLSCYNGDTVRLTQGPVKHMGRVEVFDRRSDQWGTICANDVSSYQYTLASIICKSLGYYSYRHYGHASNSSNIGLSSNSPIVNGSIRCSYASHVYQNLYQCLDFGSHLEPSPSRCTPDQEWILICRPLVDLNGKINTRYVNYYQGSVALYNSKKLRYEYICDDGWDLIDAHVVCRMLGFSGAHDATFRSEYGQPNLYSVSLSNVQCSGTEDSIFDCPHESNSNCRIAGVQCLATRLVDGPNQYSGRIEIYNIHTYRSYNSYTIFPYQWGTICDDAQWTVQDATVLCRSLGYQFNEENIPLNQSYGFATGPVWTRYVSCSGNEHYIWHCSYNTNNYYTYYNGQYIYRPYCNHSTDIGIVCSAPLPVRLQGSPYTSVGRLEVWRNNMWGSVCNEHFTIEAANVVCRQLGFDQAMDYTPGGYFGQSTGPIHMSNVSCTGNEAAITDCTFTTTHSCDHSQDVGIYCQDIATYMLYIT